MVAFVTSVCGQTTTENNSKTNVTLLLYKKTDEMPISSTTFRQAWKGYL